MTSSVETSLPPPLPPRGSRSPSGSVWRTVLKIILLSLLAVLISVACYAGYIAWRVNDVIESTGTPEVVEPQQSAKVKPLTVLMMGKDTRAATGSLNTDVIMVASLSPSDKTATVVSIPRDTIIDVPGYNSYKANAYYANFYVADKMSAEAKTKELFSRYLAVPVDYVVLVDFKGFADIIDVLGGLDIVVDMDMCYQDPTDGTDIRLSEGKKKLDGPQTLDFVRYRTSNCGTRDSNDVERNERQQHVLNQMIGRLKSFSTVTRIAPIIEAIGKNVQTDIPSEQIWNFLRAYMGTDQDKIEYIHLVGQWRNPFIYVDREELQTAQRALQRQLQQ